MTHPTDQDDFDWSQLTAGHRDLSVRPRAKRSSSNSSVLPSPTQRDAFASKVIPAGQPVLQLIQDVGVTLGIPACGQPCDFLLDPTWRVRSLVAQLRRIHVSVADQPGVEAFWTALGQLEVLAAGKGIAVLHDVQARMTELLRGLFIADVFAYYVFCLFGISRATLHQRLTPGLQHVKAAKCLV